METPIALHTRVSVELIDSDGEAEQRSFTIVPSLRADLGSGLLDENAPLARLLLGHHAGETLAHAAGDLVAVRILAVEEWTADISPEAAQKRRAAVERAAAQSEITSQMIFASASGSKWGDYEVNMDKLLDDEAPSEEAPSS